MFLLKYKPSFYEDLKDVVKDKTTRRQIINKTLQMEQRAPLGKKVKGHPYCSVRVGGFRIIYPMKEGTIEFLRIFSREHDYRELKSM